MGKNKGCFRQLQFLIPATQSRKGNHSTPPRGTTHPLGKGLFTTTPSRWTERKRHLLCDRPQSEAYKGDSNVDPREGTQIHPSWANNSNRWIFSRVFTTYTKLYNKKYFLKRLTAKTLCFSISRAFLSTLSFFFFDYVLIIEYRGKA